MRARMIAFATILVWAPLASAQLETEQQAQEPAAIVASPDPSMLGGAGESCRARSDCRPGLACVGQVCTDEREGTTCGSRADCGGELVCIDHVCRSPMASRAGVSGEVVDATGDSGEWLGFQLEGVHPYAGLSVMGGPAWGIVNVGFGTRGDTTVRGAFQLGLEGGIFIGTHQLAIEISPMTFWYYQGVPGPAFQLNGTYGNWIPLYEGENVSVYWPIRVGIGMMTGNTGDNVFLQARLDLLGVAIRVGHFFVDLHLPSFRYDVTFQRGDSLHFFYWHIGGSLGYIF
ncbi:MAG: hypothetical protein K8H88_23720 [Sandaracinaceae bacterium]|nr:hypothetical protein [Sandaracinaceae bacterium]